MSDFADAALTVLRRWYWPIGLMAVALVASLVSVALRPAPRWEAAVVVQIPRTAMFVALVQFQSPHLARQAGLPGRGVSVEKMDAEYAWVRVDTETAEEGIRALEHLVGLVRARLTAAATERAARWRAGYTALVRARHAALEAYSTAADARAWERANDAARQLAELDAQLRATVQAQPSDGEELVLLDAPIARPLPTGPPRRHVLGAAAVAGLVLGGAVALVHEWCVRCNRQKGARRPDAAYPHPQA